MDILHHIFQFPGSLWVFSTGSTGAHQVSNFLEADNLPFPSVFSGLVNDQVEEAQLHPMNSGCSCFVILFLYINNSDNHECEFHNDCHCITAQKKNNKNAWLT